MSDSEVVSQDYTYNITLGPTLSSNIGFSKNSGAPSKFLFTIFNNIFKTKIEKLDDLSIKFIVPEGFSNFDYLKLMTGYTSKQTREKQDTPLYFPDTNSNAINSPVITLQITNKTNQTKVNIEFDRIIYYNKGALTSHKEKIKQIIELFNQARNEYNEIITKFNEIIDDYYKIIKEHEETYYTDSENNKNKNIELKYIESKIDIDNEYNNKLKQAKKNCITAIKTFINANNGNGNEDYPEVFNGIENLKCVLDEINVKIENYTGGSGKTRSKRSKKYKGKSKTLNKRKGLKRNTRRFS